jgi:hypothetical protein
MKLREILNKIGKKRLDNWLLMFCLGLAYDGILQFFIFWFRGDWIKSTAYWINEGSGFNGINSFSNYLIWFSQVYFCLFIPLIVYLGFKYKNNFNGIKMKIFSVFILSFMFTFLIINYSFTIISEWVFLFIIVYIIILLRFNIIFSLSFSILSFQVANMLWEMAEINIYFIGTILSYILIYSIFIIVLYKLKIKINLYIILSFIPILFSWIYYYPIWRAWSTKDISEYLSQINNLSIYFRLFVFPFLIIIALTIYFTYRKHSNVYIPK